MHQRQRRFRERVPEVAIKTSHLRRQQQALVNHGPGRKGRNVEVADVDRPAIRRTEASRVECLFADGQDFAFEFVLILDAGIADQDRLTDHRHGVDDALAQTRGIGRYVAPGNNGLSFPRRVALEGGNTGFPRGLFLRQEAHGYRVMAGLRQVVSSLGRPVAQQPVRYLDQTAGAIAHQRIIADGAPVVEIGQDFEPAQDNVVRLSALNIGDKADAARIVLVHRVIQPLFQRCLHPNPVLSPGSAPLWMDGSVIQTRLSVRPDTL